MAEKEYIERGALVGILDAKSEMAMGAPKAVFASVSKMVELLPAADVVEVVRCKDCANCRYVDAADIYRCDRRGYYSEEVKPSDYCSRGERKEQT